MSVLAEEQKRKWNEERMEGTGSAGREIHCLVFLAWVMRERKQKTPDQDAAALMHPGFNTGLKIIDALSAISIRIPADSSAERQLILIRSVIPLTRDETKENEKRVRGSSEYSFLYRALFPRQLSISVASSSHGNIRSNFVC